MLPGMSPLADWRSLSDVLPGADPETEVLLAAEEVLPVEPAIEAHEESPRSPEHEAADDDTLSTASSLVSDLLSEADASFTLMDELGFTPHTQCPTWPHLVDIHCSLMEVAYQEGGAQENWRIPDYSRLIVQCIQAGIASWQTARRLPVVPYLRPERSCPRVLGKIQDAARIHPTMPNWKPMYRRIWEQLTHMLAREVTEDRDRARMIVVGEPLPPTSDDRARLVVGCEPVSTSTVDAPVPSSLADRSARAKDEAPEAATRSGSSGGARRSRPRSSKRDPKCAKPEDTNAKPESKCQSL